MFGRRRRPEDDESDSRLFRCSFCNKSQKEVRKLIAGPAVYICDECVNICVDVVNRDSHEETSPSEQAADTGRQSVICGLCKLDTLLSSALILPGRGAVCAACASAVAHAVSRNTQPPN
jgi:hypothetical protein